MYTGVCVPGIHAATGLVVLALTLMVLCEGTVHSVCRRPQYSVTNPPRRYRQQCSLASNDADCKVLTVNPGPVVLTQRRSRVHSRTLPSQNEGTRELRESLALRRMQRWSGSQHGSTKSKPAL